jgi:hypothetical protein
MGPVEERPGGQGSIGEIRERVGGEIGEGSGRDIDNDETLLIAEAVVALVDLFGSRLGEWDS